ncbi:MAG: sporulation integral membrane protein YtvI [Firmicutes bacterium]|nr:sporulation integral membrane protein YtvI [Bacillota bacterium]
MYSRIQKLLVHLLVAALVIAGLWLTFRYLLPWLSPFLLAMGIAAASEPVVRRMSGKRFPRAGAAGLCTFLLLAALIAILTLGLGRALSELGNLAGALPDLLAKASDKLSAWQDKILAYIAKTPGNLSGFLQAALDTSVAQLTQLPGVISAALLNLARGFAMQLPAILLFVITGGIGAYFCSASFPEILGFLKRQLPKTWQTKARLVYGDLKRSLGSWAKAQLIMMGITFCELLLAFLLLRVPYSLLLAVVIALVDMLPVFGTGTILLPWAVIAALSGNNGLALGLFITEMVITLVRNTVQAKLLGDQLGLHPLVTLVALYVGFRVMGFWGMLLFPILAVLLKQMNDHKMIRLWKTVENE